MRLASLTPRRPAPVAPPSQASVAVRRRPISDVGVKVAAHPGSDDVLLHHSPIPTYYFQQSLPKLAIPTLDATCDKYKYFTAPLLAPDVHADLCVAVEAFRAGDGRQLHEALTAWDKTHPSSYISDLWYDAYLRNRDPLPLNLNPQLTFRDDPNPAKNEQAARGADLAHAAARFLLTLEASALPPDVYWALAKPAARNRAVQAVLSTLVPRRWAYYPFYALQAYPLDMSQYPRLFRSTRIPRAERDELWSSPLHTRHIVVQAGPRFYRVNVLDEGATAPLPPGEIEAALRAVLADAATAGSTADAYRAEPPVGALTAAGRDAWAAARGALERGARVNAASLGDIDGALFVLTLDHSAPADHEALSRAMLHGDGRNRWFDKCFNLIVTANGRAGVNWEHAWGDGVAVLYFFNEVFAASTAAPARPRAPSPPPAALDDGSGPTGVARLRWDLSPSGAPGVADAIRAAEASFDAVVAGTDLRVYQTPALTKADVKRSKLSPDGLMQMALQLAHVRAHGYTPSTYESASTAGFAHGRTETIRSATPEAVAMCAAFGGRSGGGASSSVSQEAQRARYVALSAAAARHSGHARDAALGRGVDRHLFALEAWTRKVGLDGGRYPRLFAHPGHAIFRDIRLSTSTLESPALEGGGFGPVSAHSYGVGYGIEERGAHFHVMNHRGGSGGGGGRAHEPDRIPGDHPPCDGHAFTDAVEGALGDIRECITVAQRTGLVDEMAVAATKSKRR